MSLTMSKKVRLARRNLVVLTNFKDGQIVCIPFVRFFGPGLEVDLKKSTWRQHGETHNLGHCRCLYRGILRQYGARNETIVFGVFDRSKIRHIQSLVRYLNELIRFERLLEA